MIKDWIMLVEFCEIVQKLYPPKTKFRFDDDYHNYTDYRNRLTYRIKVGTLDSVVVKGSTYVKTTDALTCMVECFDDLEGITDLFDKFTHDHDLGEVYLTSSEMDKLKSIEILKNDRTKNLLRYIFDRYYEELSEKEIEVIRTLNHSDEITIGDRKNIEDILRNHIFPSNNGRSRNSIKWRY